VAQSLGQIEVQDWEALLLGAAPAGHDRGLGAALAEPEPLHEAALWANFEAASRRSGSPFHFGLKGFFALVLERAGRAV
jgi:hypothetical protein